MPFNLTVDPSTTLTPLPDRPLSIADLVGRGIRWLRLNFRFFFAIFIAPCLIYELVWEGAYWLITHTNVPWWGAGIGLTAFLIAAIHYEVAVRQVALWRTMSGKSPDYRTALRNSRTPAVLLLFLPSICLIEIYFVLLLIVSDRSLFSDQYSYVFGTLALRLFSIPYSIAANWNSLLVCIYEMESESIYDAIKRILHLQWRAPFRILFMLTFFAGMGFAFRMCLMAFSMLEAIPHVTTGMVHTLVESIIFCIRTVIYGASQTVLAGFQVAVTTCLYNELRMRLEGADIVQQLEELKRTSYS